MLWGGSLAVADRKVGVSGFFGVFTVLKAFGLV